MKTYLRNLKRPVVFVLGILCLVGITACVCGVPKASEAAPYVIGFDFLKPINPTDSHEVARLKWALDHYAIRSASRVFAFGKLVWPIGDAPPMEKMKTKRAIKSEHAAAVDASAGHPSHTTTADSNDHPETGAARPAHTEYLSFADAADLRNFIDCLANKNCGSD